MDIINNILKEGHYEAILHTSRNAMYSPLDRGDETAIYVANCAKILKQPLFEVLRKELGEFSVIADYFRLNTPEVDTGQRIHSDGLILGRQPTHGCVFYIDAQEGTSFYSHEKWGKELPWGEVMDEKEYGKDVWREHSRYEAVNNSMIVYPANVFHQRSEKRATTARYVWVAFIDTGERG